MRVSVSRAVSVAVLVLLAGLTGCDDATTGSSQEDVQTDLQSGGVGASLAAPSADSAGDMIVGMMDQLSSPNPAVVGGVAYWAAADKDHLRLHQPDADVRTRSIHADG